MRPQVNDEILDETSGKDPPVIPVLDCLEACSNNLRDFREPGASIQLKFGENQQVGFVGLNRVVRGVMNCLRMVFVLDRLDPFVPFERPCEVCWVIQLEVRTRVLIVLYPNCLMLSNQSSLLNCS